MRVDAFSDALSGIRSAALRQATSAHNVANSSSDAVQSLRTTQAEGAGGGSEARVERAPAPARVDLSREGVEQLRARVQLQAAAGVLRASSELTGTLLDVLA